MDVSVIVPIYNSEGYLQKCLHSLSCQKGVDCEFICVDDGSTDKSVVIIEKFAKIDQRFICIKNNHNGIASARNRGLLQASGKYVCFLDSDDCFKKKALISLYSLAEKTHCDSIKFNSKLIHGQKWMKKTFSNHNELVSNFSKKDIFKYSDCRPFIWCHFIKRKILEKIQFNDTLIIGEDQEFVIHYLTNIKSILFTSKRYSIHYNRPHSIMNSITAAEKCQENLKLVKIVSAYIDEKNNYYKNWVFDTLYYSYTLSNMSQSI